MPLALVTGAGVRVGKAIALALAREGFDLVLHANRSLDGVNDTAAKVRALGRAAQVEQADLSDDAAVDALAARVRAHADARGAEQGARGGAAAGALDAVVHSAAAFEEVPLDELTRERHRRMQRINVEAPLFLTQQLVPALERSAWAAGPCVVHIVDIQAHRPIAGYAHYTASKGALFALTKALTVELAPRIRVCGVSPGIAAFPAEYPDEMRARITKRIPLKREGTPEDIGAAVAFLVKAPYVNGVVLPVDGGWEVTL